MLPDPEVRLDLKAKLRQRSLQTRVQAAAWGLPSRSPIVVELDVTTACDLGCPECISQNLLRTGRFTDERLTLLAAEFVEAGVRAVILIGGGEPLLHPRVSDLIRSLARNDLQVGLTTNGTQLHRHLDAVARSVSWTRVSVDAGTEATYGMFRPSRGHRGPAFRQVIRNMRSLATEKVGAVGFSFLLMARRRGDGPVEAHNFHEVVIATKLARDIGCDYIEFKPAYDLSHSLVKPPADLLGELADQLQQASDISSSEFRVIAPPHLHRVIAQDPLGQPKRYTRCPTAQLRTLVTPSGVYVCPYHRGRPGARYGDVQSRSFVELWQGSDRTELAATFDPSKNCGFNCIRHESNLELLESPAPTPVDDFGDYFI